MKKQIIVKAPPSLTEQTIVIDVDVADPSVVVPPPVVNVPAAQITPGAITQTVTITGTTPPPAPVPVPVTRKNLILAVDFNKGLLPGATVLNMQPASRFAIKTIGAKKYAEVTCAKGDAVIPPVTGSNRSEFNVPTNQAEPYKDGTERWYGIEILLPTSFVSDVSPELLFQTHEFSGTASPHFALWTKGGRWYIAINGQQDLDMGAYEFNKDTDYVFHIKWSMVAAGFIEVYKNGEKIKTYTGPNMPGDTKLPYLKCGIYKWDWVKNPGRSSVLSRTVYIGSIYIGNEKATYDDVKP